MAIAAPWGQNPSVAIGGCLVAAAPATSHVPIVSLIGVNKPMVNSLIVSLIVINSELSVVESGWNYYGSWFIIPVSMIKRKIVCDNGSSTMASKLVSQWLYHWWTPSSVLTLTPLRTPVWVSARQLATGRGTGISPWSGQRSHAERIKMGNHQMVGKNRKNIYWFSTDWG